MSMYSRSTGFCGKVVGSNERETEAQYTPTKGRQPEVSPPANPRNRSGTPFEQCTPPRIRSCMKPDRGSTLGCWGFGRNRGERADIS